MTKVTKVPYSILKDQNHPIIPNDATEADVTYIEDGTGSFIIFETVAGTAVFDSTCSLVRFRQESGTSGSIEATGEQLIGSSVWTSAEEICLDFIKKNGE